MLPTIKILTIASVIATFTGAVLCAIYGNGTEQKAMGAVCCLATSAGFGWWVYRDWKKKLK
jgi:hypothetical protein